MTSHASAAGPPRRPVSTLDAGALAGLLARYRAPAFRATQIGDAVWRPHVTAVEEVAQLPAGLRSALGSELLWNVVDASAVSEADDGRTLKILGRLDDGQSIETVAMETAATERRRRRSTVCVSSQVGCAVGCPFCATGQMGLTRNCTAAEIVDQVRLAGRLLAERGLGPVTHVVYMGMGEPLANYDAVAGSLRVLTGEAGLSARRITVSTSGVVPAIDRLAGEGIPVTLAISLHAANDLARDRLVPLNRAHPIATLLAAADRYASATGRRVTIEWCLIGGINDSPADADQLREAAYRLQAHVNIIPMNHVDGSPWGPPDRQATERFLSRLAGIRYTTRGTRGAEADAACGQLRAGLAQRRSVQRDGTLSAPAPVAPARS